MSARDRDSYFGGAVRWRASPKVLRTPPASVALALVCGATAAVSLMSAVVVSSALGASPTSLLVFAGWMATLALVAYQLPRWWRSELEYTVTDDHVVVRRGRLRRTIERKSISFARIRWDSAHPGVGDLELVRAVPTGALHRRLSVTLAGIAAPDRVWTILRGLTPAASTGTGHRPVAQRLDEGERVLWSAHPVVTLGAWLPRTPRALGTLALAGMIGATAWVTGAHAVESLRRVHRAGLAYGSSSFVLLVVSLSITLVVLASLAVGLAYWAAVRPVRLAARTRYLVTNQRVLIQCGDEELHLDRARIADVIERPSPGGTHDVFLVLDGPRARAVEASGAFGEEEVPGLKPVLLRLVRLDDLRAALGA